MKIKSGPWKDQKQVRNTQHDFQIFDERGRECGIQIVIKTEQFVVAADDDRSGSALTVEALVEWSNRDGKNHDATWFEVGVDYYRMEGQATRNGKPFGASQHGERFKTLEDANAAATKRIEETRKRYAKKFAGNVKK
jgi:hypothetical protein